jgi:hypothetical protein
MRDNNDFIGELRKEIATGQERRSKYVVIKLTFIVGLFGIGSITISSTPLLPLIYLIPLVVFIFDLYILGEDFGVKRAGRFIRGSPYAPIEEIRWESAVHDNRDPITHIANALSSFIVIIVAGVTLWNSEHTSIFYIIWSMLSVLLVMISCIYGFILVRRMKKLDKYLKNDGK